MTTTDLLLPTNREPTTPGEILREEFMVPLRMQIGDVAALTGIDRITLSRIINGHRSVTPETSIKLGRLFRLNDGYFLALQSAVDLWHASRQTKEFVVLHEQPNARSWRDMLDPHAAQRLKARARSARPGGRRGGRVAPTRKSRHPVGR
jgi:antitoxin HigA-1